MAAARNLSEISDKDFDKSLAKELEKLDEIEGGEEDVNKYKSQVSETRNAPKPKVLLAYPYEIEHLKNNLFTTIHDKSKDLENYFKNNNEPLAFSFHGFIVKIIPSE